MNMVFSYTAEGVICAAEAVHYTNDFSGSDETSCFKDINEGKQAERADQ